MFHLQKCQDLQFPRASCVLGSVYSPIYEISAVTGRQQEASWSPGDPESQGYFRFYRLDMISACLAYFKKSFGKWLLPKLFQLSCSNTLEGEVLTTSETAKKQTLILYVNWC